MAITIDAEFKALIPPLTAEERQQLETNILAEGIRDALVVWGNILVDGHNRYEIACKHNLPYKVVQKEFASREDVIKWIILNQSGRRNLNNYQRSMLALELEKTFAYEAKQHKIESGGAVPQKSAKPPIDTRKELANIAGVSHDTISKVKVIRESASPEIKQALDKGDISINAVYKDIKRAEAKQERAEVIAKQEEDIANGIIKPEGKFDVIAMDPPWNYGTGFDPNGRRVANPYPEMSQQELLAMDVPANDNCIMFLWTTQKFLWDAKQLLDTWGFNYRATVVWDKEKIGMGDLLRMQCEFCLIGIKGKPVLKDVHNIRDIIREPRREHSRKPEAFYELVNNMCTGIKLDYFSREKREGWYSFGNDTEKFSVQ